jgi:hypothetical protein
MNWYLISIGAALVLVGMFFYTERWTAAEKSGYDWKHMVNHGVLLGIVMGIGIAMSWAGVLMGLL